MLNGIQPSEFWEMTPAEFMAVIDIRRESNRATARPGAGPPRLDRREIADRRAWLADMKRRYPDTPGLGKPNGGDHDATFTEGS